jgi:hypothetical protein
LLVAGCWFNAVLRVTGTAGPAMNRIEPATNNQQLSN